MIFHGRARYIVLAALSLLYFLLMAGTFNSLGLVLPFMVKDLGLDWAQAGFGFTLLGTACGAASLAPALLIRWVGVRVTLLMGTALLIAGFATMAATHGVLAYELGATLLGLGFCFCGTVPSVHIISGMFERRSTALGVYFTTGNMGSVGGPLLFYAVSEIWSDWRIYWMLFAVAALVLGTFAAIVTGGGTNEPARDPSAADDAADRGQWSMRDALRTVQFWMIVAAYTGCLLVNTTVHSFSFQQLLEHGQSKASATALISLSALVGAIGAGLAGLVGERVEARRLTALSLGMLALTSICLALPNGWIALGGFAVTFGVGLGVSWVSTALLMQDYFGRRASLELYSIMTAVSTSAALGPGLGGMVRDRTGSFSAVFLILAAIDAALLVGVLVMRRPAPRPLARSAIRPLDGAALEQPLG
jgi:MFS family permease